MWHKYKNGNHEVYINDENGTKIRKTIDDNATEFISDFADSVDFKITNKCFNNCAFCHEKSSPTGLVGNMDDWKFLDTLHPYTEMAIGGGDVLTFDKLYDLLELLKSKNIYANITVQQNNIFDNKIDYLVEHELVKGIGVSLYGYRKDDIERIKSLPNTVIHLINGVTACEDSFRQLADKDLKILILGYKTFGRGIEFIKDSPWIQDNMNWVEKNIEDYMMKFKVVSFDNLAVEQLKLKDKLTEKQWKMFYGGDDGTHTFYIDGVNKQFAKSSTSTERFDLLDNIDDMFHIIQQQ
jgi:hypothetical protein